MSPIPRSTETPQRTEDGSHFNSSRPWFRRPSLFGGRSNHFELVDVEEQQVVDVEEQQVVEAAADSVAVAAGGRGGRRPGVRVKAAVVVARRQEIFRDVAGHVGADLLPGDAVEG